MAASNQPKIITIVSTGRRNFTVAGAALFRRNIARFR
jgi:hypothetical protein